MAYSRQPDEMACRMATGGLLNRQAAIESPVWMLTANSPQATQTNACLHGVPPGMHELTEYAPVVRVALANQESRVVAKLLVQLFWHVGVFKRHAKV